MGALRLLIRVLRVALRGLLRRPVRTLLTVQGVLWGTALGVSLPAVINGSRQAAEREATQYGTDRILITQDAVPEEYRFTWRLVEQIRRALADQVRAVTACDIGTATVRAGEHVRELDVLGVDAHFFTARQLQFLEGRPINHQDLQQRRPVVVISTETPLPPEYRRVGATIELAGKTMRIVGIVRHPPEQTDEFGYAANHFLRGLARDLTDTLGAIRAPGLEMVLSRSAIYVPYEVLALSKPRWIEVRCAPDRVAKISRRLFLWLSERGYQPIIYANVVATVLYSEAMERVIELNRVVFGLAVTVGAIVVASLMLLNVWERRREIAIRRVEGARWWHIAVQFMVETTVVCWIGAVAGIPTGLALAAIRCYFSPAAAAQWTVPTMEIAVTMVVVTATGLLAGLLPAYRAVRIDPVEVLRFD